MTEAIPATSERLSPFEREMRAGHEAREGKGDPKTAIGHYKRAQSIAPTLVEQAQAMQAIGVSLNVHGRRFFSEALQHLESALSIAERLTTPNPLLLGAIKRDLGQLHYNISMMERRHLEYEDEIDSKSDAKRYFEESFEALYPAGEKAEAAATLGFWGMMLVETGEVVTGRAMIMEASLDFLELDEPHVVYETNNLIRDMRVSSIPRRWMLLRRGLWLTAKGQASAGSRNRVLAAFMGNAIYLRLREHQQRS